MTKKKRIYNKPNYVMNFHNIRDTRMSFLQEVEYIEKHIMRYLYTSDRYFARMLSYEIVSYYRQLRKGKTRLQSELQEL